MKRELLVSTAKELIKVLGLVDSNKKPVVVKLKATNEELKELITQAAEELEPQDKLTKRAISVLEDLGINLFDEEPKEEEEEEEDKTPPKGKGKKAKVDEDDEEDEEEDDKEKPKLKKKEEEKPAKKKEKKGESNIDLAVRLLKEKASDKEIKKAFTELYKAKGQTDAEFIKKRITTYMKIAKDKK